MSQFRYRIPAEVKREVDKRDGEFCRRCCRRKSTQYHHIKHRSNGGKETVENLIRLCEPCHKAWHKIKDRRVTFAEWIARGDPQTKFW
jgi:5-methylcytosine-specific restriction endonuclease McrA